MRLLWLSHHDLKIMYAATHEIQHKTSSDCDSNLTWRLLYKMLQGLLCQLIHMAVRYELSLREEKCGNTLKIEWGVNVTWLKGSDKNKKAQISETLENL